MTELPYDQEHSRRAFEDKGRCLRVWPALAVLAEDTLPVVRVDYSGDAGPIRALEVVADFGEVLAEIGAAAFEEVVYQRCVEVGGDLPGEETITARLKATPDLGERLVALGYTRQPDDGEYEGAVMIRNEIVRPLVTVSGAAARLEIVR